MSDTHTTPTEAAITAAHAALSAKVRALAVDLPGVTFGYLGNVGVDRSGPYDDRGWKIFLPHPGRIGGVGDSVGLGATERLPAALARWPALEREARHLYALVDRSPVLAHGFGR